MSAKARMGRPRNHPGKAGWNGNAMRLARRDRMMTLSDVARAIGVSKSTVARWEHGDVDPPASAAALIAKALRVSRAVLGKNTRKRRRQTGQAKRKKVQ